MSVDVDIKTILMQELLLQRKTGEFCDVHLTLGDKVIPVHASLLCAISPFIKTLLVDKLQISDNRRSPVVINLFRKDSIDCFTCLEALMDMIYGSKTNLESIHADHIHSICKILSFSDLLMNIINNNIKTGVCDIKTDIAVQTDDFDEDSDFIDSSPASPDTSDSDKRDDTNCITKTTSKNKTALRNLKLRKLMGNVELKNLVHLSGKMQSCIECKFKCAKPNDLLVHLRNTKHGNQVCSLCLTKTDSVEELLDHYLLHDHPKPFICTFCDVRFQTRTLLVQHLPRHSKETPYVCHLCNKGFKWKHGLKSHLITHSNEKLHLCDECGFTATHSKSLKAHKLLHTGELFKCTFLGCTHTCSRKENMKKHLDTHNNDKPFVCDICGNKFTQSKSLKRHALIHSSEGYRMCPHCPFMALRADNLKSHIIRQHYDKRSKAYQNLSDEVDMPSKLIEGHLIILANAASSLNKI